jgi:hypothetical protein
MFVAKRYFHRHSGLFLPKYKKPLELCAFDIEKKNGPLHNPLNECEKINNNINNIIHNTHKECALNPYNEYEKTTHNTALNAIKSCRSNPLNECEKSRHNLPPPCCRDP